MKVVLSAKASHQLEALLDYLETEWGAASRRKFQARLGRYISAIKSMPTAFPATKKFSGTYKCVVSPQTSLYYRVKEDCIEIVSVQANRMDF